MTAYYNEHDPKAAAWLRELIKAGLIAPGDVDERSIEDVCPDDLAGYTQCHFFAGIGGWSYALRLAGWPDDRPVWTGSCPCQPFSAAGAGAGVTDSRHLWPDFWWLVAQRRPAIVFGEQVASRAGREWLAGVRADLEELGYDFGAADLCAAGVGAPHIRQRLYWVADSGLSGPARQRQHGGNAEIQQAGRRDEGAAAGFAGGPLGRLGNADSGRRELERQQEHGAEQGERRLSADGSSARRPWGGAIWLPCADGKARRIEPGIEPLAHGVSGRVGLLRGYGNAIVPQVAAQFVKAAL